MQVLNPNGVREQILKLSISANYNRIVECMENRKKKPIAKINNSGNQKKFWKSIVDWFF